MAYADGEILVVEDDPEISELVGAYVQIAGFSYCAALNGSDALRMATDRHPAMIILDIMLPDLDGFEVCRRLKREPGTAQIPVVMLTALGRDEHRRQGVECGAAGYLTKPFDPDHLMDVIHREAHCNGHSHAPAATATPGSADKPTPKG